MLKKIKWLCGGVLVYSQVQLIFPFIAEAQILSIRPYLAGNTVASVSLYFGQQFSNSLCADVFADNVYWGSPSINGSTISTPYVFSSRGGACPAYFNPVYGVTAFHNYDFGVLKSGNYTFSFMGDSQSFSVANHPPTISGSPTTDIKQGTTYSFIPIVNDVDGDSLTYTITNKPSWAIFNTSNGSLTGTAVEGTYRDIQISVSDGNNGAASLQSFSLIVSSSLGDTGTQVPVMEGWWLLPVILVGLGIFGRRRSG